MNPSIHFSHFFSAVLLFPSAPQANSLSETAFPMTRGTEISRSHPVSASKKLPKELFH